MTRRATADYALRATDESGAAFATFNQRVDGSQKKLKGFSAASVKAFKAATVGLLAGTSAAIIGGGLILREITRISSEMDDLSKTSRQLGLSMEVLSGLRPVAEHAGADFGVVTKNLERMHGAAIKAIQGNKELGQAFELLGINANKFVDLDVESQMFVLAEAFKLGGRGFTGVSLKATDRSELLRRIFGRRGAGEMGRLFEGGAMGLAGGLARAEQFGLVRTGAEGRAAERLQDALADLSHAWDGMRESLLGSVPVLDAFTEKIDTLTGFLLSVTGFLRGADRGDVRQMAGSARGVAAGAVGYFRNVPVYKPLFQMVDLLRRIEAKPAGAVLQ